MTAQTAPRRALLLLLPLLLAATSLCAQHPEPKPQADSLPRIYVREDASEEYYSRYGSAYGLIFRYESLLDRLGSSTAAGDSTLAKARARFENLYGGALKRMRAFNRVLNIQGEMLAAERGIDSAVVRLLEAQRDSLPQLIETLYTNLAFNRQEESVQTFGNCFDPNYLRNPMREVEDSLLYRHDFGPTDGFRATLRLTIPASFDVSTKTTGMLGMASMNILGAICACGGQGEFYVSMTNSPNTAGVPTADQVRKEVQSPELQQSMREAVIRLNRHLLSLEFYQHPSGLVGMRSRALVYEGTKLTSLLVTHGLFIPGYTVTIAYGVRGDGTQSQAELERRLAHWQPLGEFILERAEIRVGE